jgi:hypothetical protein
LGAMAPRPVITTRCFCAMERSFSYNAGDLWMQQLCCFRVMWSNTNIIILYF